MERTSRVINVGSTMLAYWVTPLLGRFPHLCHEREFAFFVVWMRGDSQFALFVVWMRGDYQLQLNEVREASPNKTRSGAVSF